MSSSKKLARNNKLSKLTPYLFILPWIFGVLLFTAGPLIMSLIMSFFSWPVIGESEFIGFANYIEMFTNDSQFYDSLLISAKFTLIFVPLKLVLALMLAVILTKRVPLGDGFRVIFYLPTIISSVAISIIFDWMLDGNYGVINYLLSLIGIDGPDWLNEPNSAMFALVLASIWTVGALMLVFYSALRSIPLELYEAARIDGAGEVKTFFSITLPLITPTILFNLITSVISTLQSLDLVMLLTNGGPLRSTYMYGLYVYNNAFQRRQLGYASANAWVMFVITLVLTLLIFRSSDMWVYTAENKPKKSKKKRRG